MLNIQKNISNIKKQLSTLAIYYHRNPSDIRLIAVSKNQSIAHIQQAIAAGQLEFGESYLQEALPKITLLNNAAIQWHFIGPLQSNKTKKIAEHFSWVHSVASLKVAKRLNDQRPAELAPLNICLEINISNEATKSGINKNHVYSLAEYCLSLPKLKLRGLMAIPAKKDHLPEQRAELHKLKLIYTELLAAGFTLDTLSMGMSDDIEAAIAEGSTLIRVGKSIFSNY